MKSQLVSSAEPDAVRDGLILEAEEVAVLVRAELIQGFLAQKSSNGSLQNDGGDGSQDGAGGDGVSKAIKLELLAYHEKGESSVRADTLLDRELVSARDGELMDRELVKAADDAIASSSSRGKHSANSCTESFSEDRSKQGGTQTVCRIAPVASIVGTGASPAAIEVLDVGDSSDKNQSSIHGGSQAGDNPKLEEVKHLDVAEGEERSPLGSNVKMLKEVRGPVVDLVGSIGLSIASMVPSSDPLELAAVGGILTGNSGFGGRSHAKLGNGDNAGSQAVCLNAGVEADVAVDREQALSLEFRPPAPGTE